jgi:hypothetical protein
MQGCLSFAKLCRLRLGLVPVSAFANVFKVVSGRALCSQRRESS